MHILEIPSFFPPYGGHFCIDQSKALVAQGHVVRVVAALNVSARLTPKLYLRASRRPYDVMMDGIEVTRCEVRSLPALNKLNARRWCRMVQRMADAYVRRYGKPDGQHQQHRRRKRAGAGGAFRGRRHHPQHDSRERQLQNRHDRVRVSLQGEHERYGLYVRAYLEG